MDLIEAIVIRLKYDYRHCAIVKPFPSQRMWRRGEKLKRKIQEMLEPFGMIRYYLFEICCGKRVVLLPIRIPLRRSLGKIKLKLSTEKYTCLLRITRLDIFCD